MKALVTVLSLAIASPAFAAAWNVDAAHSSAEFSVRHMMVTNTTGEFTGIKGTFDINDSNLSASKIDVTIDTTTIDTRDAKRDGHLKSKDFFDVAKHPTMRFVSKKITKAGEGYKVVGDLTIRGKTKSVSLDAELTGVVKHPFTGASVRGIHATTTIDRQNWGLTWNKSMDKGGLLVGNEVELTINVELFQKATRKGS